MHEYKSKFSEHKNLVIQFRLQGFFIVNVNFIMLCIFFDLYVAK